MEPQPVTLPAAVNEQVVARAAPPQAGPEPEPQAPAREKYSAFQIATSTTLGVMAGLGAAVAAHWIGGSDKWFKWTKPAMGDIANGAAWAALLGALSGGENYVGQTKEIAQGKDRKITHLERVIAEKNEMMNAARAKS